jgi:two-component system, NarL family, invasion response regulator UvrY
MTCRILVVDDHVATQRGLREIILCALPGTEIGFANSDSEALQALGGQHWDVAILDLSLPGRGGLELIGALKQRDPRVRFLIYTMHSEKQFGVRALRAGADGYLTKDSPPEEIARAVQRLLAGRRYISSDLAEQLTLAVQNENAGEEYRDLSHREDQVLRAIVAGKTLTEISVELNLSAKTITTYRARILEKLGLSNNAELIRYAIHHKLIDIPENP